VSISTSKDVSSLNVLFPPFIKLVADCTFLLLIGGFSAAGFFTVIGSIEILGGTSLSFFYSSSTAEMALIEERASLIAFLELSAIFLAI